MKFLGISYEPSLRRSGGTTVSRVCSALALLLALLVLLYLCAVSLTETVDMNTNNPAWENVETRTDSFLCNVLSFAVLTALTVGWLLLCDRAPAWLVTLLTLTAVTAFGVCFVLSSQSAPTHDSYLVSNAAYLASENDPSGLSGEYFRRFPFQLGYVLWSEGWIRLFGTGNNYLSIEILNVVCLSVAYFAILRSVRLLFGDGRAFRACAFLMLLCLQPILFCTFTYGNLPSLMFSALAIWQVLSMNGERTDLLHGIEAALLIGLAVAIKKNSLIVAVALVIVMLIRAIRRKNATETAAALVCVLLCAVSVWGLPLAAQAHYERRFNLKFGKGIPMSSWAAMGLNEAYIAPGWYESRYTVVNFSECNGDHDEAHRRSMEVVRERIGFFSKNPDYATEFFTAKVRSQWNEPSFQSLWTNQVRGQYAEKGALASWFCSSHEAQVKAFMNATLQFVYVFAAIGAFLLLRRRRIEDALFPACFLGGFLYHLVFEAKSQYIIPYLVLLLPLAAYGIAGVFVRRR